MSYPTLYCLEVIIKCKTYQQQIISEMPLQDRKRIRMNAGPQSSVCFTAFFSSLFASQLILHWKDHSNKVNLFWPCCFFHYKSRSRNQLLITKIGIDKWERTILTCWENNKVKHISLSLSPLGWNSESSSTKSPPITTQRNSEALLTKNIPELVLLRLWSSGWCMLTAAVWWWSNSEHEAKKVSKERRRSKTQSVEHFLSISRPCLWSGN